MKQSGRMKLKLPGFSLPDDKTTLDLRHAYDSRLLVGQEAIKTRTVRLSSNLVVQFQTKTVLVGKIDSGSMNPFELPGSGLFQNTHGRSGGSGFKHAGVFENKASLFSR